MKKNGKKAWERFKLLIKLELEQFQDPYYQGVAAQLAFYLFLSVLPTAILISQLLGIFSLSIEEIQVWANVNMTGEGARAINGLLRYHPSGANNIFMALTALWAASKTQFSLLRITNYTLSDGTFIGKSFLRDRIRAVVTIFIVLMTLVVALVVLVYLPIILKLILGPGKALDVANNVWMTLRWFFVTLLYFFMISYIYYVMPSKRFPFKDIIPGSLFSSVGFVIVNFIYNKYLVLNTRNDILYGSMANIVMLLIWFWLIAWVLCLGITLNRVWWATRSKNPVPIPDHMVERRKPINIF